MHICRRRCQAIAVICIRVDSLRATDSGNLTCIHHFEPLATAGEPIRYCDDRVELKIV
jgi:hypothetical protein